MLITSKQTLTDGIKQAIINQPIFWSDDRLLHFFMDFKYNGKWISSVSINNELTKIEVEIN